MNKYIELMDRQQQEFNAQPIGFAFSMDQFESKMRSWGLDPETDKDKIVSLSFGGFIQRKDLAAFHEMTSRHHAEFEKAIEEDMTGEGFIYDMFLAELNNHEYSYTMDTSEALEALGFTAEQVVNDPRLNHGICLAHQAIVG